MKNKPTIVCLCGSSRYFEEFHAANYRETLAGRIVLSLAFLPHDASAADKKALDELHMRKIELADEVLILNVGGYIGESTRKELRYAQSLGKVIRSLLPLQ